MKAAVGKGILCKEGNMFFLWPIQGASEERMINGLFGYTEIPIRGVFHIVGQMDVTLSRIAEIQQRLSAFENKPANQSDSKEFEGLLTGFLSESGANADSEGDIQSTGTKGQLEAMITERAKQYGLDPSLAKAVVQTESNFNPLAVSPVGAKGLMQLMPSTAKGLGVEDSFNPEQNVDGGIRYLKGLLNKYQSVPEAVAAYNAGPGAVDKYKGIPPYAETQHYTDKVMKLYQQYAQKTGGQP